MKDLTANERLLYLHALVDLVMTRAPNSEEKNVPPNPQVLSKTKVRGALERVHKVCSVSEFNKENIHLPQSFTGFLIRQRDLDQKRLDQAHEDKERAVKNLRRTKSELKHRPIKQEQTVEHLERTISALDAAVKFYRLLIFSITGDSKYSAIRFGSKVANYYDLDSQERAQLQIFFAKAWVTFHCYQLLASATLGGKEMVHAAS